jgi:O-antigen ligase
MTGTNIETFLSPSVAGATGVRVKPLVRWALYATAFLIPLEMPDRFAFEVTTIMGSLFLLSTVLQPTLCFGRLPWAVAAYALYLCVQVLALIHGENYPGGLDLDQVNKILLLELLWILFFWVCSNLFREERVYRTTLWALVLGCMIRAALPLMGVARTEYLRGGTGGTGERITALGQNANQSAQVLALGLLALIGLAYVQPRGGFRPRFLGWGAAGLIAIGMVGTGSRGGLVTLAMGLVVYLSTGQSLKTRIRNAVVAVVALGLLFLLVTRSEVMLTRLSKAESGSFSQREHIFPLLLVMFRERPLLGWGPIVNKYELAARLGDPTHDRRDAHNLVLEILTSSGTLGAIVFFIGVYLCLRAAWTARAGPRGVVPLAMGLAVLAGNMSENRIAGPLLWLVLAGAWSAGTTEAGRSWLRLIALRLVTAGQPEAALQWRATTRE